MSDKELKRNGSEYVDPTAYKALKAINNTVGGVAVQVGSVYRAMFSSTPRLLVVVATHYEHASILVLSEESKGPKSVRFATLQGTEYWATPDMISYKFYADFDTMEGQLVPESIDLLLKKTAERLGLSKPESKATDDGAYSAYRELKAKYRELEVQNKVLQDDLEELTKQQTEYKPNDAQQEIARLTAQRDLYKEEYKELLASLIGK